MSWCERGRKGELLMTRMWTIAEWMASDDEMTVSFDLTLTTVYSISPRQCPPSPPPFPSKTNSTACPDSISLATEVLWPGLFPNGTFWLAISRTGLINSAYQLVTLCRNPTAHCRPLAYVSSATPKSSNSAAPGSAPVRPVRAFYRKMRIGEG